jgi:hypothetical protein
MGFVLTMPPKTHAASKKPFYFLTHLKPPLLSIAGIAGNFNGSRNGSVIVEVENKILTKH